MKVSKILLQTMAIAIVAGVTASCKKQIKKVPVVQETKTKMDSIDNCPACGMG